ncbi:MAG TPA: DUF6029 family protein, partial [Ignavibacteriales bacterium]|nr:DUF6029 family protein [Ignavibacteriales bacterium]
MKLFTLILLLITAGATAFGQTSDARISGNFQIDAQYYQKDSAIGAEEVDQKILSNSFLYLNYSMGNFNAGLRYEAYLDPLLGFDQGYKGSGIAYRFVEFNTDVFSATAGHFYEQFGSGLIFRAYEERQLGVDNAVDGIRVKFRPADGISFTGIYGRQRLYWGLGEGIIRGGDLDLNVNDLFTELLPSDIQLNIGGSVISKFQPDNEPFYNLPENVLSYSTRAAVAGGNYTVEAEYAYKYNDPNATNFYNFNPGTGILLSASYFFPGFGISFDYHRIDNMDFRSDRNALENRLLLNFFPPQTKLHTYSLATIYPFSTQLNGETGIQGEITYTFSKGTALGGEYGTTLSLNYS